jgi:hypothetical protein
VRPPTSDDAKVKDAIMKPTTMTQVGMMSVMTTTARRLFELLEPICLVTYFADECNEELAAIGHRTYWDGYFASRAAPLGRVPAQVVHAAFTASPTGRPRGTSRARGRRSRPRRPSPPGSGAARLLYGGSSVTSWPTPRAWRAPPT